MRANHVLGTLRNKPIRFVDELRLCMLRVALLQHFNVRTEAWEQFEPEGATGVLVLAESHFSAHTYPETGDVYLDVFCCSDSFSPDACIACIEEVFGAKGDWQVILRR